MAGLAGARVVVHPLWRMTLVGGQAMTTAAFDVVVIGGGVAGCSAAITLAQQGTRVALVEAKAYPHHKVCGEVLSPGCVPMLERLGVLEAIRALNPPLDWHGAGLRRRAARAGKRDSPARRSA